MKMFRLSTKIALPVTGLFMFLNGTIVDAQQKFIIKGKVEKLTKNEKAKVHLFYYLNNDRKKIVKDSSLIVNNGFTFTGEISEPLLGHLFITPENRTFNDAFLDAGKKMPLSIGVYLEDGTIVAALHKDDPYQSVVTGTVNNNVLQQSRGIMNAYKAKERTLKEIEKEKGKTETDVKQNLRSQLSELYQQEKKEIGSLIQEHPNELASLDLITRMFNPMYYTETGEQFFSYLSPKLKETERGITYRALLDSAQRVKIGAIAPEFVLSDPSDKAHHLADYRGKYILIDFWASWCTPCRAVNPDLVKLYSNYKSDKFEILGVSLDGGMADSRQRWVKAIESDGLTWPQVSDLKGWSSPVATTYNVNAIPSNFLLDPEGKIIAKNLTIEDLKTELEKLPL